MTETPTLSDRVIPAEPGEFYNYTSEFTIERPIFVLMKCKANKNRPIEQLPILSSEANIFFQFGDSIQAKAHSVKTACVIGFLGSSVDENTLDETWLAPSHMTAEDFYEIRSRKDAEELISVCQEMCLGRQVVVKLNEGSIIAVMTSGNKYGMFLVQEITSVSIRVIACHTLRQSDK